MKFNVGGIDRMLRILVGIVLVALAATGAVGGWGWLGMVPILTGLVAFCPLYTVLGFSTCAVKEKK